MTASPKLTLSSSRDIPFDKLRLSQANVRRFKAGVSIEDLAEDIARRTLLQGLSVRPVRDDSGNETGLFEVPAGGRRFRALQLLVKQKRLAKTAKIPCVVREEGLAEEDSLAENACREALHPLDQFRAFATLRDKGLSDADIAARFFVDVRIVRQRLRLAAASPKLLDAYGDDELTLEQLMAFCVTSDHKRQEVVWKRVKESYSSEPYAIRRLLTEDKVQASDKRARLVGLAAYEAAGGIVTRDLFSEHDEAWLEDVGLLDSLAHEKLAATVEDIRAEGWQWVEAQVDFPYGHTYGFDRIAGEVPELSKKEATRKAKLEAEYDALQDELEDGEGEIAEDVDRRLAEIEAELEGFDERRTVYQPEDVARAGAFVSVNPAGGLAVERGYVRPEDETAAETGDESGTGSSAESGAFAGEREAENESASDSGEAEEDGMKPLSERLLTELTQFRTLALREALANDPATAQIAVLHALTLGLFYRFASDTCLEITAKSAGFSQPAPGLSDSAPAHAIQRRHEHWATRLPESPAALWDALLHLNGDERQDLLAHCAGLAVNAVHEPWNRRQGALGHADRLAQATELDVAAVGWKPTVENYLGRVTKARILDAVRETRGEHAAQLLDHLKKGDMAREAERLLDGTGWLPEILRTPGSGDGALDGAAEPEDGDEALPPFLADAAE